MCACVSDSDFFVAGVEGLELEIAHPMLEIGLDFYYNYYYYGPSELPTVMHHEENWSVFESAPAVTEDRLWGLLVSA